MAMSHARLLVRATVGGREDTGGSERLGVAVVDGGGVTTNSGTCSPVESELEHASLHLPRGRAQTAPAALLPCQSTEAAAYVTASANRGVIAMRARWERPSFGPDPVVHVLRPVNRWSEHVGVEVIASMPGECTDARGSL